MRHSATLGVVVLLSMSQGCAQYKGVVKPGREFAALPPDLRSFGDRSIDAVLKANAPVTFPTTLAVAKLVRPTAYARYGSSDRTCQLQNISGAEAADWRKLAAAREGRPPQVDQLQFISTLLAGNNPGLKDLRDAAAQLHAPLLLVYLQDDNHDSGYNDAAMAYWTIVGLFLVPGNTVGHYSNCQALMVDTRTGLIVATADGESKKEEKVLWGATEIADRRTEQQAIAEAVRNLQQDVGNTLTNVALAGATRSK